jgi:hypothetical protein
MPIWTHATTITRSTLCWKKSSDVSIRIVAPGRVPPGATAPLVVAITRTGDAIDAPVTLAWRRSEPPGGEVVFGDAGGAAERQLPRTTFAVLAVFGRTATPAATPDVTLRVTLDGEDFDALRVAVAAPAATVAVHAADGTGPAPATLRPGARARLRAVATPAAPGRFAWISVEPAGLAAIGSVSDAAVEVEARTPVTAHRTMAVLFLPDGGGPDALGLHSFRAEYGGRVEDRSVAPHNAAADTAHVFLPGGTPFTVVDATGAVAATGTLDAAGRFAVALPPGGPYELRVPGFVGLGS